MKRITKSWGYRQAPDIIRRKLTAFYRIFLCHDDWILIIETDICANIAVVIIEFMLDDTDLMFT